MKVIIGLGNPGEEYANTRHNAGVLLVDKIYELKFEKDEYGFRRKKDIYVYESETVVLVKTAGIFMNESGKIITELNYMNKDLGNLYVAHDDLDIRLGGYKIQQGVGPREHNGVLAVERALGRTDFWRIRIGTDNRNEAERRQINGEEYVLGRFRAEERKVINRVVEKIANEIIEATD